MAKTYEAMLRSKESPVVPEWHFIDLKSGKQSSDLEKKIDFYKGNQGAKVFNFAAGRKREGVSTVVTNFANYIAKKKTSKNILLIDANIKHPVLHIPFNQPLEPGLNDVLTKKVTLSQAVCNTESDKISLLPAGASGPEVSKGFGQEQFLEIVSLLREQYDHILIDSPPVLESPDALTLSIGSDVTFLIIHARKTRKEVAERSKRLLQDNDCLIGGVILNAIQHVIPEWLYNFV